MFKKIKAAFITLAVIATSAMAQSPSQINYQGAARDGAGAPIANQQIRVRLKVHDGTSNGTVQYSEVRKPTTNANGLFNIVIGSTGALSTTGSFAAIKWGSGNKYLQVEMDPTGGTSYTNMGTQQLVSVPYAQFATTASTLKFPMSATDSINGAMFALNNKNGNGINSFSKNGLGMYAWSDNFNGVFAENNSTVHGAIYGNNYNSGPGVKGSSQSGNGIYGVSTSPTLSAIEALNNSGGPGIKSVASQNNGVWGETQSASSYGVYGFNPAGYGIKGYTTSSSAGVFGEAQSVVGGIGVYGRSMNGKGVFGYSEDGIGVKALSTNGTAVDASCDWGYALKTWGKVQIAGGGTNPGKGKVLTSDSLGNATWQGAVAFKEHGFYSSTISAWSSDTLDFLQEEYDLSNNFDSNTDAFVAPVSGLYHFDIQVTVEFKAGQYIHLALYQKVALGGVAFPGEIHYHSDVNSTMPVTLSIDCLAAAGDQFKLTAYNSSGQSMNIYSLWPYTLDQNRFSGRLITKF